MPLNGLSRAAIVILFLAAPQGCKSVPPVSEHARAQANREALEGSSPVVPASAVQPTDVPASQDLASPIPVAPYRADAEDDEGFQFSDLAPKKVYGNMKELAGYGPDEDVAREHYREGQRLHAEKQFKDAASQFKSAAGRWPDSPLEEDALFMAGESYFFADDYPEASDYFEKLLKQHPHTRHLDKTAARLFSIGRYWEQAHMADPSLPVSPNLLDGTRPAFDTWGNAIKAYDMVRMYDPTGPLADDSIMATANAYFLQDRYEEAAYHYDLLRKDYPNSEHQVQAHILGMKSKMSMYQGPSYDGTPLEQAGDIAEQALTQFRTELGEERELVLNTKNQVVEELAARDWSLAQYYDKKKCYGSARIYYQAILKEHSRTSFAQRAQARLAEIQGLPDEPVDRFEWLGRMFPTEEEAAIRRVQRRTPLEWIGDMVPRPQRASEEFRDEPSP